VNIFKGVKIGRIFIVLKAYPLIGKPLLKLMHAFPILQKGREKHDQYSKAKSERRLDKQTDRKDFIRFPPFPNFQHSTNGRSYILRHNDEKGMTREEIIKTTNLLIVAGSETSATLLSGAMFYLLKNPSTLEKLVTEIRTSFPDVNVMTMQKLAKMQYLNAVLQEALRVYPPAPGLFSRKMLPGGAVINGYFIPANVRHLHYFFIVFLFSIPGSDNE
jgi:cytochrome P450